DSSTFESDLIAALANGQGPDMVLLPQDLILKELNKFYVVPFANYSERTFQDSFIQEGELYLTSNGVIGFPFTVDPMVMYWNRDTFSNAGVSEPPVSWAQFFDLAPKMTIKDSNNNIVESALAFGESTNVAHFKDILSLLSLQAGTPIVAADSQGNLKSELDASIGQGLVPGEEALSYFTQFSNPLKTIYSWNRAMPLDRDAFVAGQLAVYFGYASELTAIRAANPNLNFDVAMVPQSGTKKLTFGNMEAIALLKSSKNVSSAFTAAVTLTSAPLATEWSSETGMPPVRRDLLATLPGDAAASIFYQSALISIAWLDPNREATAQVFSAMVENVISGNLLVSDSVKAASDSIDSYLRADSSGS
ncbi:MAG: extracellular solute-binding protein, partial [Patescibacteria group bacterium]|nr:extracellular solute-binding protein [Patescibacteria group bacterium]